MMCNEGGSNEALPGLLCEIPHFDFLPELEQLLGLPVGFYEALLKEDDWSFVIKLHSLVEAAITQLLTQVIDKPELSDIFSRLDLGGQSTGKMAFIKSLGLLSEDERRFISQLSQLRNSLVHDVTSVNVNLAAYYDSLSVADRKGFTKAFRWGYKSADEVPARISDDEFDLPATLKGTANVLMDFDVQKVAIWVGGLLMLRNLHFAVGTATYQKQRRDLDSRIAVAVTDLFAVPDENGVDNP